MLYILTGILSLYCFIILLLIFGFINLKPQIPAQTETKTKFSICIPFRNESKNLPALLESLKNLDYLKNRFEILLIDDHSTDNSVQTITDFCQKNADFASKIRILSQKSVSHSGKKAALSIAIEQANNAWIITTDADCRVPAQWLLQFNNFILESGKTFVAGPVEFLKTPGYFLNRFQQLDFLSLQGATIGGFGLRKPVLCNGANLAFAKAEFYRLNGYLPHQQVASGDDVLLMQQFISDNPKNIGYLKSKKAVVSTQPQKSWKSLINQRKRWAAKASHYSDFVAKILSLLIFLANLGCILAIFYLKSSVFLQILLILKILIDFILIYLVARFFDKKNELWAYLWISLFHPFFTVFIAINSQFGQFTWKGRHLKS